MRVSIGRGLLLSILLFGCASSPKVTELEISNAWARPTPKGSSVAAVYMRVTSPVADELVAISTSLARSASLRVAGESDPDGGGGHENHDGAVSEMAMGDVTLVLAPNSTVELAPGGLHVMLEGLERPLVEGESFELVLTFREAGEREVNVFVSTNEPTD